MFYSEWNKLLYFDFVWFLFSFKNVYVNIKEYIPNVYFLHKQLDKLYKSYTKSLFKWLYNLPFRRKNLHKNVALRSTLYDILLGRRRSSYTVKEKLQLNWSSLVTRKWRSIQSGCPNAKKGASPNYRCYWYVISIICVWQWINSLIISEIIHRV